MSVDYAKLKTNLNLIMHRLKLVEKKKIELNQKARRTIGEFLNTGKVDRARIRVEQIIREDYVVESMDLVESYCDFLLSRFCQLQNSKVVDEGLASAVSSLIWVAPRFGNDVPELKVIADQLGRKYGKEYVAAVSENQLKTVNETLIKKMNTEVPPPVLVEKYLVEIAKDQKIDYKPDPRIMKEQEIFKATGFRPGVDSSDDDDDENHGHLRQPSEAPHGAGFSLIDLGDHYPMNPITQQFSAYGQPPPLPSEPPLGPTIARPSNIDTAAHDITDASAPSTHLPIGFNLSSLADASSSSTSANEAKVVSKQIKKEKSQAASTSQQASDSNQPGGSSEGPPPNYDSVVNRAANNTQYFSFGPDGKDDLNDTLPELPPVPSETIDIPRSPSMDLEDLTRRFEKLKDKK